MGRPCFPLQGGSGILLQELFSTRVSHIHPTFIQHFQIFLDYSPF